jgi:endonuclease G
MPFLRPKLPPLRRAAFLIILLAAAFGRELFVTRPAAIWGGLPEALDSWNPRTWTRVFRNDGFLVGYSDLRGVPLWVAYRLTSAPPHPRHRRPTRFRSDWRGLIPVMPADYTHSGYDRGHLAPNHAMEVVHGPQAQEDTFLMTNVAPQKPDLNRKLWERLEEVELDHFLARFGALWVWTGPVFDADIRRLKTAWRVEVPDAFFRIYLAPRPDRPPLALAFLMPQDVKGGEPLDDFLVSVDRVEELTGLDFLPDLDDGPERELEASVASEAWDLTAVARRPARYR